jgi:hypothetical protein
MIVPLGAEVLQQMALDQGRDAEATALMRRHAVWMLANLGENIKRFKGDADAKYKGLPAERRDAVLTRLRQMADGQGLRRRLAERTLGWLEGQQELGVIATLSECAKADDPDLRKYVAYALTFWEGTPQENQQAEKTLLMLAQDDGHGVRVLIEEDEPPQRRKQKP